MGTTDLKLLFDVLDDRLAVKAHESGADQFRMYRMSADNLKPCSPMNHSNSTETVTKICVPFTSFERFSIFMQETA